jgi:hypothetical protein
MLLNPGNFVWAKSFMESGAWDIFSKPMTSSSPFTLPSHCPDKVKNTCMVDPINLDQFQEQILEVKDSQTASPEIQPLQLKTPTPELGKVPSDSGSMGPWSKDIFSTCW